MGLLHPLHPDELGTPGMIVGVVSALAGGVVCATAAVLGGYLARGREYNGPGVATRNAARRHAARQQKVADVLLGVGVAVGAVLGLYVGWHLNPMGWGHEHHGLLAIVRVFVELFVAFCVAMGQAYGLGFAHGHICAWRLRREILVRKKAE